MLRRSVLLVLVALVGTLWLAGTPHTTAAASPLTGPVALHARFVIEKRGHDRDFSRRDLTLQYTGLSLNGTITPRPYRTDRNGLLEAHLPRPGDLWDFCLPDALVAKGWHFVAVRGTTGLLYRGPDFNLCARMTLVDGNNNVTLIVSR